VYFIPIVVLALVIVIGVAWSPIFALIIAVPAFAAFLAYVGLSRRADEKPAPPTATQATREAAGETHGSEDVSGGIWGEKRT
jgi:hypothetical protein